jgi:hypothetical protein
MKSNFLTSAAVVLSLGAYSVSANPVDVVGCPAETSKSSAVVQVRGGSFFGRIKMASDAYSANKLNIAFKRVSSYVAEAERVHHVARDNLAESLYLQLNDHKALLKQAQVLLDNQRLDQVHQVFASLALDLSAAKVNQAKLKHEEEIALKELLAKKEAADEVMRRWEKVKDNAVLYYSNGRPVTSKLGGAVWLLGFNPIF